MVEVLAIMIVVAVMAGATKSGRAFIREAWKATGWRSPRQSARHHSGRLGAMTGRGVAAATRSSGRTVMRGGRSAAAGIGRIGKGERPLIPLMWRGDPRDTEDGSSGAAPQAAVTGISDTRSFIPVNAEAPDGPGMNGALDREIKKIICAKYAVDDLQPDEVIVTEDGAITIDRRRRSPWARTMLVGHWKPAGKPADGAPGPESGPAESEDPPAAGKDPAPSNPSVTRPPGLEQRRTNMTARYTLNLETPTTDGEFLEAVVQIGDVLKSLAENIGTWAEGLGALHLPQSVLTPLHLISDGITDAAGGAAQSAKSFEDEFEDAREVASRGMHFTGQDAA